jgi:hypothetical protein
MPKRKKIPDIPDYKGAGTSPGNLLVQKSNPLQSLSETNLTLPEFKILDAFLSRIDSRNPEKRTVCFEKGELENLLNVSRILKDDLDKRLRHLFQVVEVKDNTKKRGFKLVSLFEEAEAAQDDDGLWQVNLTCTPSAREYIFNIENIGYLSYRLKNIINLTSRYSYILFLYLENNRFRKSWEIHLDELKKLLHCNAATYDKFFRFNGLVLKRCHQELNEKTTCQFSYEPVKKGRNVVAVKFTLETFSTLELIDPNQMTLFEECTPIDDQIGFLQDACCHSGTQTPEFNRNDMEQIFEVLVTVPDSNLPLNVPTGSIEFRRYHYLSERYAAMNRAAAKKPIRNRFAYFLKMIKTDAGNDS